MRLIVLGRHNDLICLYDFSYALHQLTGVLLVWLRDGFKQLYKSNVALINTPVSDCDFWSAAQLLAQ